MVPHAKRGLQQLFMFFFKCWGTIGQQLRKRLSFFANVKENGEVVKNYLQMVSEEVSEIESKTFSLSVNGEVKLVEFRIAELPNDMNILAFLAGDLSNAATYSSTFDNMTKKKVLMMYQKH